MSSSLVSRKNAYKITIQEENAKGEIYESVQPSFKSDEINEKDENDDDEGVEIPQDVYSLLYTEKGAKDIRVILFVTAVCVLQLVIVILIFTDLLDYESGQDWPNPPVDVSWFMKLSQYLAIVLAVATQDDLTEAISTIALILFGTHSNENKGNKCMFLISSLAKLVVGFLTLFGSLIIVIQSEIAIDLFADFAGMFFVSSVDNAAFILADAGFFWKTLKKRTDDVKMARFPKKSKTFHYIDQILVFLILAVMLGVNGWISFRQNSGDFFSHDVTIYIGDEVHQLYPLINGRYLWGEAKPRHAGRPVYTKDQCDLKCDFCCISIMYCEAEKTWTVNSFPDGDPCLDYLLTSERTNAFDPLDVPPSEWKVYDVKNSVELFAEKVKLIDNECDLDKDCNFAGTCNSETGYCDCFPGRFGFRCEATTPCENLEVDITTEEFGLYPNNFEILRDETTNEIVTTYNGRPIYVHQASPYYQLLLFYGSRWVMTSTFWFNGDFFNNINREHAIGDLLQYFDQFNPDSWYEFNQLDYISEETEMFDPVDLQWNRWMLSSPSQRVIEENRLLGLESVSSVLRCKTCNSNSETNQMCSFNGQCVNSVCVCDEGYFGTNCELSLVFGKTNLYLDHGDTFPCGACLNQEFILDKPFHEDGSYCLGSDSKTLLSSEKVPKDIAFDMNSTHFLIYVMENEVEDCQNARLIHTVTRHPDGKLVKYEDVFEITATSESSGYDSGYCTDRFPLGKDVCTFEMFSTYSGEKTVERVLFHIDVVIAGQM